MNTKQAILNVISAIDIYYSEIEYRNELIQSTNQSIADFKELVSEREAKQENLLVLKQENSKKHHYRIRLWGQEVHLPVWVQIIAILFFLYCVYTLVTSLIIFFLDILSADYSGVGTSFTNLIVGVLLIIIVSVSYLLPQIKANNTLKKSNQADFEVRSKTIAEYEQRVAYLNETIPQQEKLLNANLDVINNEILPPLNQQIRELDNALESNPLVIPADRVKDRKYLMAVYDVFTIYQYDKIGQALEKVDDRIIQDKFMDKLDQINTTIIRELNRLGDRIQDKLRDVQSGMDQLSSDIAQTNASLNSIRSTNQALIANSKRSNELLQEINNYHRRY